jgi:hypothetical protein
MATAPSLSPFRFQESRAKKFRSRAVAKALNISRSSLLHRRKWPPNDNERERQRKRRGAGLPFIPISEKSEVLD